MARKKIDGVIEAVRYTAEGKIDLVRVYKKRWLVFSDVVLVNRDELLEQLKSGCIYVTGQRKPYGGNLFDIGKQQAVDFSGSVLVGCLSMHDGDVRLNGRYKNDLAGIHPRSKWVVGNDELFVRNLGIFFSDSLGKPPMVEDVGSQTGFRG